MLVNALLIVLSVKIFCVLVFNVILLRIIVRAVRNRESYEAATAIASADASDLSTKLIHLKTEHIQLTGYIHKSVHDIRDALGALSLRCQANHGETMKEVATIVGLIGEIRGREMTHEAGQKPV